jgi:hypothetical protein
VLKTSVVRLLAAAVALGGLAIPGTGAQAAAGSGVAAGDFVGTVTFAPGESLPRTEHHLTFASVILSGVFVSDDGGQQYAGAFGIDDMTGDGGCTSATTCKPGYSGGDLPDEGGVINPFAWDTNEGFPGVGALRNGTCDGSYSRLFNEMQLTLNCGVAINNGDVQNFHATLHATVAVVPIAGDGVTNPYTQAALAGEFNSVA